MLLFDSWWPGEGVSEACSSFWLLFFKRLRDWETTGNILEEVFGYDSNLLWNILKNQQLSGNNPCCYVSNHHAYGQNNPLVSFCIFLCLCTPIGRSFWWLEHHHFEVWQPLISPFSRNEIPLFHGSKWMFPKIVPPNHPKSLDHDFVLKAIYMVHPMTLTSPSCHWTGPSVTTMRVRKLSGRESNIRSSAMRKSTSTKRSWTSSSTTWLKFSKCALGEAGVDTIWASKNTIL